MIMLILQNLVIESIIHPGYLRFSHDVSPPLAAFERGLVFNASCAKIMRLARGMHVQLCKKSPTKMFKFNLPPPPP